MTDYKGTVCEKCNEGTYRDSYNCGRDEGLECSSCGHYRQYRYGERANCESEIRMAKMEIEYAINDLENAVKKALEKISSNKSQIKFYEEKLKSAKD